MANRIPAIDFQDGCPDWQISQRSQQWLRWYEGLENAEGISVSDLPDEVQTRLKTVVREIRRLDDVTTHAVEIA